MKRAFDSGVGPGPSDHRVECPRCFHHVPLCNLDSHQRRCEKLRASFESSLAAAASSAAPSDLVGPPTSVGPVSQPTVSTPSASPAAIATAPAAASATAGGNTTLASHPTAAGSSTEAGHQKRRWKCPSCAAEHEPCCRLGEWIGQQIR